LIVLQFVTCCLLFVISYISIKKAYQHGKPLNVFLLYTPSPTDYSSGAWWWWCNAI